MSGRAHALAAATAAAVLLVAARALPALAWLALAPLVAASLRVERTGLAVLLGTTFALEVALATHAAWLAEAAQRYFSLSSLPALAAAVALCVACAAPAGALLGATLRCAATLPGAVLIPASAAVWVTWESLTRMAFPYYPWIGLAATQTTTPSVLQAASLAGQAGLSLIVAACGSALGFALARRSARDRWPAIACAIVLAGACVLYGDARLRQSDRTAPASCTIAAVDAGIAGPAVPPNEVLDRYAALTTRAAAAKPDAVIWPESALPADPLLDAALLHRLQALAGGLSTTLLAGGPRHGWDASWRPLLFNSVFRIAGAEPVESYDKRAPVPFAEAWPAVLPRPAWLHDQDVAPGSDAALLTAGGCRLGVLVCFEVERPALAAAWAAAGADALVVLSNDAQLPRRAVEAEVAEARLRAVETGLPLLRAANRGATVAIDRYGRTVAAQDGIAVAVVSAAVTAPAVRWAGPLLALCWLMAAATVLRVLRRRRAPR